MNRNDEHVKFMRRAIALAKEGIDKSAGGPFGALVVRNGRIIAEGYNQVTSANDPTAHAEIVAIRKACEVLRSFQLDDCILYASCEPCPMCLGAIYWARPKAVYFACTRHDAADIDFDDCLIYDELEKEIGQRSIPFISLLRDEGISVFAEWKKRTDLIRY
ncbi:MAG: nucleoside deaminase [FCB group bacterium]|nr:nucleoside deaminase [FCB group bacterium]